jgi:23S rRNA pseudouridine1911/1915/1917 synthase
VASELSEIIPEALAGERLDRVVAFMADVSRNRAGTAIDEGLVTLNGKEATARSRRVNTGEKIVIENLQRSPEAGPAPQAEIEIPVLHADAEIIVVNKPAGLVVHPGAGNETGTMVNGLLAQWPEISGVGSSERPGIVHRLDRGTSGVLVVARTQQAYHHLTEQLADHSMGRRYKALCWGHFEAANGVVDAPIGRSDKDRTRMAVVAAGRPARTHYEVLQEWENPEVSLAECQLETGRTHQIRVHLSAIGHALVGDGAYGGDRIGLDLDRPFLHAAHLGFEHPNGSGWVSFDAELPDDLADLLTQLKEPETDT